MFTQRKPRGFQHQWIYVDERKEKLQKMEEKAKRELGLLPPEEYKPGELIRGNITGASKHLSRRKGKRVLSTPVVLIALAIALFLLHYLVTGSWSF